MNDGRENSVAELHRNSVFDGDTLDKPLCCRTECMITWAEKD